MLFRFSYLSIWIDSKPSVSEPDLIVRKPIKYEPKEMEYYDTHLAGTQGSNFSFFAAF